MYWANDRSMVYLDPPYRPLSVTSSFISYSKGDFDDNHQVSLSRVFKELDSGGTRVLLSNSDPKNTNKDDNFFDDLYSGYTIERISANRMINSNPESRGPVTELLIRNYK